MSEVELTRLEWAGRNLRDIGRVVVDLHDVVARAETNQYSVLYLRSGEKVFVQETLVEVERLGLLTETQRALMKRCKREIREARSAGMPTSEAFAAVWEEVVAEAKLSESELASLYEELLEWTKRWLK